MAGIQTGLPDDSPGLDQFVENGLKRELEARHERNIDAARSSMPLSTRPAPEPTINRRADQLDHDAAAERVIMNTAASTPEAISHPTRLVPRIESN